MSCSAILGKHTQYFIHMLPMFSFNNVNANSCPYEPQALAQHMSLDFPIELRLASLLSCLRSPQDTNSYIRRESGH